VEDFAATMLRRLHEQNERMRLQLQFTDKEQKVLRLFYDDRLKARRTKVAKFYVYGRLCEGLAEHDWAMTMSGADIALSNLVSVGYLQTAKLGAIGSLTAQSVGRASESYELTASGLEVLQSWHPALGVRLKAWIAVAPAWLVLAGSILGGIGALWKVLEFVRQAAAR
jgi:hypothetical protein